MGHTPRGQERVGHDLATRKQQSILYQIRLISTQTSIIDSNLESQLGSGREQYIPLQVRLQIAVLWGPVYNPRPQTDIFVNLQTKPQLWFL